MTRRGGASWPRVGNSALGGNVYPRQRGQYSHTCEQGPYTPHHVATAHRTMWRPGNINLRRARPECPIIEASGVAEWLSITRLHLSNTNEFSRKVLPLTSTPAFHFVLACEIAPVSFSATQQTLHPPRFVLEEHSARLAPRKSPPLAPHVHRASPPQLFRPRLVPPSHHA